MQNKHQLKEFPRDCTLRKEYPMWLKKKTHSSEHFQK